MKDTQDKCPEAEIGSHLCDTVMPFLSSDAFNLHVLSTLIVLYTFKIFITILTFLLIVFKT